MGKASVATPADDSGAEAAGRVNAFALDLLRRLNSSSNLCISPTSIALALAMVRAGARGQTAADMDAVLHSFGAEGQASEIAALLEALRQTPLYVDEAGGISDTPSHPGQEPMVELDVSNQVFAQQGMTFEQAYLDALASSYGAGVGLLDFMKDPEAARLIINRWAGEKTHGRIPNVLQPGDVDDMTRLALANAIYLKAGWRQPFDPVKTKALPFTTASGTKVPVQTMALDEELAYSAGKGYRAVELPYGDSTLSMTIVVPDDMASFVKGLDAADLANLTSSSSMYDVGLTLPRFSADTRTELGQVLQAMGMVTPFDPSRADLSGIKPIGPEGRLFVQKVVHEANIDVVEQGTTAAAVTVVGIGTTGAGPTPTPPPHVDFHVDRPFLYFIRETNSGAVLFMGRVDDPSQK